MSSFISLPLGVLLGFKNFPGRRTIIIILNTMMSLPTVVIGLLVYSLVSRSGPLGGMGLLFSRAAIIIGQTLLSLPIIISLVYGAISRIDRRLPETLTTLGAQPGDIFIMTLKEGKIAILSALLAGFGRVIGEVGVSMMLGGNIRWYTRTLTTAIALETSKGEFELALALGLILLVISFAVNLSLHWLVKDER
ncbi:MAG: ABC transporter permease subunit [Spirochaeta sp.]|nr:ABC transporter permease subunit [Spirochaeta sp.]